jgi:putative transposase
MADHVHMLIEAKPTDAPTRIVQILKSVSARKMREEFLDTIQQYVWKEGTLWATGYYIASVADGVTTEIIQEYIKNQKKENDSARSLPRDDPQLDLSVCMTTRTNR